MKPFSFLVLITHPWAPEFSPSLKKTIIIFSLHFSHFFGGLAMNGVNTNW
jgi:hypothetical protein